MVEGGLLSGLIDAVGGSADLVDESEASLRGRERDYNVEMREQLDEDEPILLLDDDGNLDLEELEERLVLDMSRGIGRVDSCEGCGVLDVWSGVSGGSKIAGTLLFSLILRLLEHTVVKSAERREVVCRRICRTAPSKLCFPPLRSKPSQNSYPLLIG